MTPHPVDGQWLDFYALLDVPVSAAEDVIRKRIGKVYSEAAANSDHRDLARRHYFQALVERVLPQCRRVLLDPEWRAKYDRQHILNAHGDPSAKNYVAFIASMRGQEADLTGDAVLPQRLQNDINIAREVVECAWQGTQLELLPSQALSKRDAPETTATPETAGAAPIESQIAPQSLVSPPFSQPSARVTERRSNSRRSDAAVAAPISASLPVESQPQVEQVEIAAPVSPSTSLPASPIPVVVVPSTPFVPPTSFVAPTSFVEQIEPTGEVAHAKVITAQEAAEIRRRRASNPDSGEFVVPAGRILPPKPGQQAPNSRVSVGDAALSSRRRLISPTSMNLMVAIAGVLLTISIQRFGATPAVAANVGRTPIFVAVAPEMEGALLRAENDWEKTPEGANFDLVVQNVDSRTGLRRALDAGAGTPDVWIPSDASWVDLYNRKAAHLKRETIASDEFIAQSPMVLLSRSDRAGALQSAFPNHQITSWNALRGVVARGATGHLGLADPQKTESGALARFSMAREWGTGHGVAPAMVAQRADFWSWMASFEDNSPSAAARTGDMVKDMVQGTTGRFWWVIAYESDALRWMSAGKKLEIYYLPRTTYVNHPFCALERVGASDGVVQGRASFEKFLRSEGVQKQLLSDGFRPSEISLKLKTGSNPFLNRDFRAHGARLEGLPLEERSNAAATQNIAAEWGRRYG